MQPDAAQQVVSVIDARLVAVGGGIISALVLVVIRLLSNAAVSAIEAAGQRIGKVETEVREIDGSVAENITTIALHERRLGEAEGEIKSLRERQHALGNALQRRAKGRA